MAWEVIFSARSRNDLEQIVQHIARDDLAAAERFGSKLIDQAESLADAPEMGPRLPQKPDTRFFPVGSYLIICIDHLVIPGSRQAAANYRLAAYAPRTSDKRSFASAR